MKDREAAVCRWIVRSVCVGPFNTCHGFGCAAEAFCHGCPRRTGPPVCRSGEGRPHDVAFDSRVTPPFRGIVALQFVGQVCECGGIACAGGVHGGLHNTVYQPVAKSCPGPGLSEEAEQMTWTSQVSKVGERGSEHHVASVSGQVHRGAHDG